MNDNLTAISDAFLAASLPIDPDDMEKAAEQVVAYYETAPATIALPADDVADRFTEMWTLWLREGGIPSGELQAVVERAVSATPEMTALGGRRYFDLVRDLEEKYFMGRDYAIALIGCSPLIRTLVVEQHLGLDRIRIIVNIPGASFKTIGKLLTDMGVKPPFDADNKSAIHAIYENDMNEISSLFGDVLPQDADETFKGLIGSFANSHAYGEDVCELVYIGYKPYLFMLYYELLTLESADRFPGQGIYECKPRGTTDLYREMYNTTQGNVYLNNAKSVYSLDMEWANTKLGTETQNGAIILAGLFDYLAQLPYSTRCRVARITRSYLVLMAAHSEISTSLPTVAPHNVMDFVKAVSSANSLTKGVLDQRLVEFLTMCMYGDDGWFPRGLGSSVNESNASGRKYGDVEYYDLKGKRQIHAFEAHGGGLRDEYVEDHVNSLKGTVEYYKADAAQRGEDYDCEVEIVYVAHDVSRLDKYQDGYSIAIEGVPFTFRFVTFGELLDEAGGMDAVAQRTDLFEELIHKRISRLPDAYALKKRYCEVADIESSGAYGE